MSFGAIHTNDRKKMLPFKTILEGKKIIFVWNKLNSKRIGHIYDVISSAEVSLYLVKNTYHENEDLGFISFEELEKMYNKQYLNIVFEEKVFNIKTNITDLLNFKGYALITDYDIYDMVKEQLIEFIGEEKYYDF